jgi:hypothetical protein
MAEYIVSSYYEDNTGPITGLAPTIRIWELSATGQDLVVGSPCGSGMAVDGVMTEVGDCGSPVTTSDGFYQFVFTDVMGYDPEKTYVLRVDGGGTLITRLRYQTGSITPADSVSVETIVDGVWDEPRSDHLIAGSTGEALTQIRTNTLDIINNLYLDADSVLNLVKFLTKMEAGRTKIDPVAKTLTVYDEDCTTVLRVFELYDSTGTPSVVDVCERVPVTKGPSDTSTITDTCP